MTPEEFLKREQELVSAISNAINDCVYIKGRVRETTMAVERTSAQLKEQETMLHAAENGVVQRAKVLEDARTAYIQLLLEKASMEASLREAKDKPHVSEADFSPNPDSMEVERDF